MQTTLNKIKSHNPCGIQNPSDTQQGWGKLLHHLGKTEADDDALDFRTILESNGVKDTIWAMRTVDGCEHQILGFLGECFEIALPAFREQFGSESSDAAMLAFKNYLAHDSEANREALFTFWESIVWEQIGLCTANFSKEAYFITRIAINSATKKLYRSGHHDFKEANDAAILAIGSLLLKYI
jgi:hypothetical protein